MAESNNAAKSTDTRNTVLNMLAETLEDGGFSHVVINDTFSAAEYTARDRAFTSRLYLGTLEWLIYIDFCINKFSRIPTVKMKPAILNILRISVYQMLFMDAVPDHAVLNEAGRLAAKRGFKGLVPFVNGVLRSIQKAIREDREALEKEMPENIRYSVPKWMYKLVCDAYGAESGADFFDRALGSEKPLVIRLNTGKADADRRRAEELIIKTLEREGLSVEPVSEEDCYYLRGFESLTGLKAFTDGLFSVQDISSVHAALIGCRELEKSGIEEPLIVDVCAAPGGKSICAAQYFPRGRIISRDISQAKTALIDENISRLGLTNMKSEVFDATIPDEGLAGKADMVIADLPCSGLGVIGRRPDIKLRVREKDISALAEIQRSILDTVCSYVKDGGLLIYSTCTVTPGENRDNVRWFLEGHSFELVNEEQIIKGAGDGFYVAVLKKA